MRLSMLSDNPFVKDLTAEEYSLLEGLFEPFEAAAHTLLIKQGESATYLYLIVEGRISLRYKPYDGPKITLTHLRAGGIFGWSAVVGNDIYTSDAVSMMPVRLMRLKGRDLRRLCKQHPAEGTRILEKRAASVAPRWVYARRQIQGLLQESLLPI